MKKLLFLLVVGSHYVVANPLLEAINRSDLSLVDSLLNEKNYSEKTLHGLLKEASLVEGQQKRAGLNWLDLFNKAAGSSLAILGMSLVVDEITGNPRAPRRGPQIDTGDSLLPAKPPRRGSFNYGVIGCGFLGAGIGAYFATIGFSNLRKKSRIDNAGALVELITYKLEQVTVDDVDTLTCSMSLKEARLALEKAILASDFYGVRKAVYALEYHGVTAENDRIDYTQLAAEILSNRQSEIPLLTSVDDQINIGVGAVGCIAGGWKLIQGLFKSYKKVPSFLGKSTTDYGFKMRTVGISGIIAAVGAKLLINGLNRNAQKKRLHDAELIEKFIRERA